ncbi:MAG: hypothetical protein CM15mV137_170 [uncultured marine virus]|nr:MAG: hypothetical protein CM15mV137_170 [uncultured marine virus]
MEGKAFYLHQNPRFGEKKRWFYFMGGMIRGIAKQMGGKYKEIWGRLG